METRLNNQTLTLYPLFTQTHTATVTISDVPLTLITVMTLYDTLKWLKLYAV